jgi:hypothetical protein
MLFDPVRTDPYAWNPALGRERRWRDERVTIIDTPMAKPPSRAEPGGVQFSATRQSKAGNSPWAVNHLRLSGAALGLVLALVSACGGGTEPSIAPSGDPTAGAEGPSRPTGPPPSFLAPGTRVRVRIDVARIRRSPLATDLASALRSSTTWQAFAGGSGTDPIQDFDAFLVGSEGLDSERWIVVIRHPHSDAEVRRRLLQTAVDRGTQLAWREVNGFAAIAWPTASRVPHSLVLTGEQELVLAPDDELERIASVARDHAVRRSRGETQLEPELAMREDEIATLVLDLPLPRRDGYPDPPDRTRVAVDEIQNGAIRIALRAEFASESAARAGYDWLRAQVQYWSGLIVLRAIGLHRPLEEARIALSGNAVDVEATLTVEEARRVLQFWALSQSMGSPS